MEKARTRLKRAILSAHSSLSKGSSWWWWKWWLLAMAAVVFIAHHGTNANFEQDVVVADNVVSEAKAENVNVIQTKRDDAVSHKKKSNLNKKRKRKNEVEDDRLPDAPREAQLDLMDRMVKMSGSDTVFKNYRLVKDMLSWWNPEASNWAQRASVDYRRKLRAESTRGKRQPWPTKVGMTERESTLERCSCRRRVNSTLPEGQTQGATEAQRKASMCSGHAADRGGQQRVLGLSFYGNPNSKLGKERQYFQGIKENLALVPKFYPGWVLRLYYDLDSSDPLMDDLCELACGDPNIDLCYVREIPAAGNISKIFAMIWRFFPLIDDQVDHFVSRDLDSRLNPREAAAVSDWLSDPAAPAFHFMRDHPAHAIEILGSGWGVRLRQLERDFANDAFQTAAKDKLFWAPRKAYGHDQGFLKRYIWPWGKWSAVSHDSYTCAQFPRTRAFPTQRQMGANNFVASTVFANDVMRQECPEKCRPKEHKEWIYC